MLFSFFFYFALTANGLRCRQEIYKSSGGPTFCFFFIFKFLFAIFSFFIFSFVPSASNCPFLSNRIIRTHCPHSNDGFLLTQKKRKKQNVRIDLNVPLKKARNKNVIQLFSNRMNSRRIPEMWPTQTGCQAGRTIFVSRGGVQISDFRFQVTCFVVTGSCLVQRGLVHKIMIFDFVTPFGLTNSNN